MVSGEKIAAIIAMAKRMRKNTLRLAHAAGNNGAHIAPSLSIIEIVATLYGAIMKLDIKNPQWVERDRFILSKGHGALGYYTALAEVGFITQDELNTFEKNGSFLPGQPTMNVAKGIEFSSGSLGLGLSFGVGISLIGRQQHKNYKVYVLLGDGECNEGSVWEAIMAASHFSLNNLVAIVDCNKMQSDGLTKNIMDMGNMVGKWESFGWEAAEVDGHDVAELCRVFSHDSSRPYVVIAHTVKGKGISFMEHNREWHHNRLSSEQYELAVAEVERG